jgi:hypothetical protein
MKKLLLTFSLLALLTSCGGRGGRAAGGNDTLAREMNWPFTVDVSEEYPMEPVSFQEVFGELEYIPLETGAECLVGDYPGLQYPVITDRDIFFACGRDVFRFGRDGTFRNRIGRLGNGPGEFLSATEICVDERAEEVLVYDVLGKNIFVYGYDGRFRRALRTDSQSIVEDMAVMNDSTLLIGNYQIQDTPVDLYQLISLRDGHLIRSVMPPLDEPKASAGTGHDPETFFGLNSDPDPTRGFREGGLGGMVRSADGYAEYRETKSIYYVTDERTMLSDLVMDTVYTVSASGDLTPRYIKMPSPMKVDPERRRYSGLRFETDRYAFFIAAGSGGRMGYKLDKTTGAFTESYLYNADIDHERTRENRIVYPTGTSTGTFGQFYQPLYLIQWLEEGKLSGELAALAATLKEDDNPVLLTQKIK